MARTGKISVKTQDIFPIIKKWLYSEHDIFLRELISNSCDAITKRAGLSRGKNIEIPEGKVKVVINKSAKTIQIIDNGVGMTEEEVEKYIANLAFSGAEEFAEKMKDMKADVSREDIIGKFGLGFYSAFMVADKVVVDTKSMNEDAKPSKWTCEGETDYTFDEGTRSDVGTTITLHINDESKDFLDQYKTRSVTAKYCSFMPYPVILEDTDAIADAKIAEEKNKKDAEEKGNEYVTPAQTIDQINNTTPIWNVDPKELKDEDYKHFYNKEFPMEQDPLFWIHLKVDHPFTLNGVLFFPKLNPNKPVQENNIKLYSKQVFVSDSVKSIIPDFLGLLKGVIDSTDIPLNVSRSSLQGDPNIQKISNYVVKKVAEALKKLFKNDRERYEQIWDDIALFVKYGIISDTKFDEAMRKYVLSRTTSGKLVTFEEYKKSIPEDFKEKIGDKILTFEKDHADASLKSQLTAAGIEAIELEKIIDPHFTQHVEYQKQGETSIQFSPIDAEIENLFSDTENSSEEERSEVVNLFKEVLDVKEDNNELDIEAKSMANTTSPAYFKVDHQMKKMQQMTQQFGGGASALPIKKTLVVNPLNPLIQRTMKLWSDKEDAKKKDLAKKLCLHVQDLASFSSDEMKEKDREAFVNRSVDLLNNLLQ